MHNNSNIYYFINEFNKNEIKNLNKKIILIYRNYETNYTQNYIKKIYDYCKKNKRKFFIANDLKTALTLKLDGLYIPSFNKLSNYKNINKPCRFRIIGSAHNQMEVINKEKQGCEMIFISPIFRTSKYKLFLGINKFNKVCLNSNTKIIALGGINSLNFKKLSLTKSIGFAGISWIKKNGLNKFRPF
jgi:thiamine-phosphate pyrophosphorylase